MMHKSNTVNSIILIFIIILMKVDTLQQSFFQEHQANVSAMALHSGKAIREGHALLSVSGGGGRAVSS